MLSGVALAVTLGMAGCGTDEADGCSFINHPNNPEPRCQERESKLPTPQLAFKSTCETVGEYLEEGCPTEGRVAGCEIGNDSAQRIVDWYYSPKTRDDVVAECANEGTVVDP